MGKATPFDPDRIFDALLRSEVRFIVIGGLAAVAQGAGWPTFDVDIVIATDEDNLRAVLALPTELRAEYDTLHQPPIRPDFERLNTLPGPQLFRTMHGRLDVLREAGGETYESLIVDSVQLEQEGRILRCACLEALIRMKRAAGRPKDREGLAALVATVRERRGKGGNE